MANNYQEDRRMGVTMTDQHGRRWNGTLEKATMHPTGPLVPAFTAPFYPPHEHMKPVAGNPMEIFIDYIAWENELQDAHNAYHQLLRTEALRRYGQRAAAAIEDPPEELLMVVGQPPEPLMPVQAAADDEPFVLGFTDEMPAWAVPFFAKKEEDEVKVNAARPWRAEQKKTRASREG